ncbi:MAG: hypothetical protein IPM66_03730 [Acidobacteriota bacterium]|nr:MAG: hypothetical protein IPM66_03730 [Acidobacteriota bacterium]
MNQKTLTILVFVLLLGVAAWIVIDFIRLGHLTASPVRTVILVIAALILIFVRRRMRA